MPTVQLSHDSISRTTLMREPAQAKGDCTECGKKGRMWQYYRIADDNNRPLTNLNRLKPFCCVGCFRDYHR